MSFEIPGLKNGVCKAAVDLSTKSLRFVKVTGPVTLNTCSVLGEASLGVLQNKPQAGESCEVMIDGVTKVIAGAAIAAGARVMTDANGAAVTAATAGSQVQGIALEAAAGAGEIIAIQLLRAGQI